MTSDPSASSRVVLAFHERWWQDRAEGRECDLGEYLALWPGHEVAIAREFLSLRDEDAGGAGIDGTLPPAPGPGGARLGPFRLFEELGRGGQGVVYRAHDERLGRTVALKVLHATADPTGAAFLRFQREATVASKLDHPGICAVLEAGREGTTAWIAMRFVEGESLARRIATRHDRTLGDFNQTLADPAAGAGSGPGSASMGPATERWRRPASRPPGFSATASTRGEIHDVARFLAAAARAVHAAHEAGVVHRDLKPGNLMVSRGSGSDADRQSAAGETGVSALVHSGEHPVILDFGLARDDSVAGISLTATGDVFGTPAYMAPEQLRQDGPPPDRRADVWALGVTLYETFTLRRPFEGPTHDGLARAILGREPPDVRQFATCVSRDLAVVVATALEKDLGRRYQTAAALADDLEAAVEHRPISARPVGPAGRLLRWARREPAKAAILVLLALGIPTVTGLGVYIFATRNDVRAAEEAETRRGVERLLEEGFLGADEPDARPSLERFAEVLRREPGNLEALMGRALCLTWTGRVQESLDSIEGQGAPDALPPALRRIRVSLLRQLRRGDDAAAVVAGLSPPETAVELLVAGMARMSDFRREGRAAAEEARRLFSASILRAPAARPLHYFLASKAAAWAGDTEAVTELLAAIRLLWGASSRARFACGNALYLIHDHAQARAEYREALRLDPGSDRAHMGCADMEVQNGDYEAALDLFRKAMALSPGNPASAAGAAHCLISLERFDDARRVIEEALRMSPDEAVLVQVSGFLAAKTGDHEQAIVRYRRSLEIWPGSAVAHTNLGHSLRDTGRPEDAEIEYRRAIGLNSRLVPPRLALGVLLGNRGENPAARDEILVADRLKPGDPDILYNLGVAQLLCGDPGAAVGPLSQCVAVKPDHRLARLKLSRALNDRGDRDEAIAAAQDAMAAGHASTALCYFAGRWLSSAGRIEEAAAAYRESVRIDPGNAEAWCNLGQRLKDLGRYQEALEAARRGHAIGSARPKWNYPSEIWVAACEELLDADSRLRTALSGQDPAPSGHEWLRMAEVSRTRKRPADEARCLEQVWKADPTLAGESSEPVRFRAAEAAIRASLDGSKEDGAAWRARALSWLEDESRRLEAVFDAGRVRGEALAGILESWMASEDLATVRDGKVLDGLPPEEVSAWIAFWTRIATLKSRCDA